MPAEFKFEAVVVFTCMCGWKVTTGKASEEPHLLHSIPPCADFMDLNLPEFLQRVRLSKGIITLWDLKA